MNQKSTLPFGLDWLNQQEDNLRQLQSGSSRTRRVDGSPIYFHRIENVLQDAGCPRGPSDLVKKIIKTTRARQSYGLPVGTTASRLLAECVLNDTDILLKNMGMKFSRYVDDFRIEISAGREAHSILCQLAEHLMVTEGLSLNVSKTKMTSIKEIRRSSKARLQDVFTSAEMEKMHAFITLSYGDDDKPEVEDLIANPFVSAEILQNKLDEIGDKKGHRLICVQSGPSRSAFSARHRRRSTARETRGPTLLRATRVLPRA